MKIFKNTFYIIVFLLPITLSSCGFQPVYSNDKKENEKNVLIYLRQIEVEPINTIEGAEFYDHINNILPANNKDPKFLLKTSLSYSTEHSIISKSSDVLRENHKLVTNYSLIEKATNKEITSGNFTTISSYSTTFAPYINIVRSSDASLNLAIQAAEEVRSRLILFFVSDTKI